MTREDAYNSVSYEFDGEDTWISDLTEYSFKNIIDKIYDSFEQRIAELVDSQAHDTQVHIQMLNRIKELESPKTCEGCRYEMFYGSDNCTNCIRAKFVWDNYEPKDTE